MKELSIFIDESGDFGEYNYRSPYYILALVFHEQSNNLTRVIQNFNKRLTALGFSDHSIHTAPIIRKEDIYKQTDINTRRKMLAYTMGFIRHISIKWTSVSIEKKQFNNIDDETSKLAKDLSQFIKENLSYLLSFDTIKIYYDNGQSEIKTLINSVFSSNLPNIKMKNILSTDYRLFQVADFICTFDLLSKKCNNKSLSKSELIFFGNERNLYRNYLKPLLRFKF